MDDIFNLSIIFLLIVSFAVGWYSTEGSKSQLIRLGDIFILGPFLIWLGLREKVPWIKIFLIFLGMATIGYNLRNYIAQK